MKHASFVAPLLQLIGEGASAELEWFASGYETDYYVLLDLRNEIAVAYLALGELDAYKYNNQAYTSLYKQISVDASLEEYCERMQLSANNKLVAIILCVVLLVALLVGYYLLYLRHRLIYRYGLEQVLETNRQVLTVPVLHQQERADWVSVLVHVLFKEVSELVPLDVLGLAVVSDDSKGLEYAFSSKDEGEEEMKMVMQGCFDSGNEGWDAEKKMGCLPLSVEVGGENRCVGVMALRCDMYSEKEADRLLLELVKKDKKQEKHIKEDYLVILQKIIILFIEIQELRNQLLLNMVL